MKYTNLYGLDPIGENGSNLQRIYDIFISVFGTCDKNFKINLHLCFSAADILSNEHRESKL